MQLTGLHPEDVKAAIRKRFRTVRAFERAKGLPDKSVHNLLRGNKSRRVETAVVKLLTSEESAEPDALCELSQDSAVSRHPHRLSAGAR